MYQRPQSKMIWENASSEQDRPGIPRSGLLYRAGRCLRQTPGEPTLESAEYDAIEGVPGTVGALVAPARAPGADQR
jgi:hypothetical protein